jgi:hypothetical protein
MQPSKFDSYPGYTDRDGSLLDKAAPVTHSRQSVHT